MKLISQALPSSESFRANEAAHLAALHTIREAAFSTPDRRFLRSGRWPHMGCTVGPPLRRG